MEVKQERQDEKKPSFIKRFSPSFLRVCVVSLDGCDYMVLLRSNIL